MPETSIARRRLITAGIMTGMFLAALEATVIGTAMPTVVAALGGMEHYSWVFSAYLLTSTVTVPLWGKLSDLYGRRLFYQIGIALFLGGSILCGLSRTMPQLVAWRAVQGLGAGALVPLGMTIIGDIYTLRERARMQGLFSGVWGLSSVVGPLVGGFITDALSWRWVFFINLPFGVAAAAIIGFALVEPRRTEHPSIDYAGATTLTAAVTLLMLALVEGGDPSQLLRPRNIAIFLTTAALVAAFVAIERRAREPIIPLDLLRNRVVAVAVIVGFLAGAAMFGAISFVPLFAQGGLGATATQAGTLLTPLMLSWVLMSIVGGRLMLRTGYRPLVLTGLTIMPIAFFVMSTFGRGTPLRALVPVLAGIGAGLGLVMLTLLIAVQHSVPRERLGIATSLNQFFRSIGGAVGVAIMGAMLSAGLAAAAGTGAGAIDPGSVVDPVTRASLAPEQLARLEGALVESLQDVFRISGIVSVIALLVAFTLPRDTHRAAESEAGDGERMVMAEMTTIDPEHEPCCGEDESPRSRLSS